MKNVSFYLTLCLILLISCNREKRLHVSPASHQVSHSFAQRSSQSTEVLHAVSLGLIDLASEERFANIVKTLCTEAGRVNAYTVTTTEILDAYNDAENDLLTKVYNSALAHSSDSSIAQFAVDNFLSYDVEEGTYHIELCNLFMYDELCVEKKYNVGRTLSRIHC